MDENSYRRQKENLVSIEQNENIIQLTQDLYVKQSLYEYFKQLNDQMILQSRNIRLIKPQYKTNEINMELFSKRGGVGLGVGVFNSSSTRNITEQRSSALPYLYSQQSLNKVRSMPKMTPVKQQSSNIYDITLRSNISNFKHPKLLSTCSNSTNRQISHPAKTKSLSIHHKSTKEVLSKFNTINKEFSKALNKFITKDQTKVTKTIEKQLNKLKDPIVSFHFCDQLLESITRKVGFYDQKNKLIGEEDVANIINKELTGFLSKHNTIKSLNNTVSYLSSPNLINSPKIDMSNSNSNSNINTKPKTKTLHSFYYQHTPIKVIQLSKSYDNNIKRKIHPMTQLLDKMSQTSFRKKEIKKQQYMTQIQSKDSSCLNKEEEDQIIRQIIEQKTKSSFHSLLGSLCRNNNNRNNDKNHISKNVTSIIEENSESTLMLLKSRPFGKNKSIIPNNDDIFGTDNNNNKKDKENEEKDAITPIVPRKKETDFIRKKKTIRIQRGGSSIRVTDWNDNNNNNTQDNSPKRSKTKKYMTQLHPIKAKEDDSKVSFYKGQMIKSFLSREEKKKKREYEAQMKKEQEERDRVVALYVNEINAKYAQERKKKQEENYKEYQEKIKEEEKKFSQIRQQEEIKKEIENPDWLSQTMFYQVFNQNGTNDNSSNNNNNTNEKKVITAIQEVTCGIPDHLLFSQASIHNQHSSKEDSDDISRKNSNTINMLSPIVIQDDQQSAFPSIDSDYHFDEETEKHEVNELNHNAFLSDKRRKAMLLRLKNSINYTLSKNPLNERGEMMLKAFKQSIASLQKENEEDYAKKLAESYKNYKIELDNANKAMEDERRINLFVDNLKDTLDRVNAIKRNGRNKIKVVDYRFKTYASTFLGQEDN